MNRRCPECRAPLGPAAVRCACGHELPEARDARADPERPACGVCGGAMERMAPHCPACGAQGYPALRSRRGRTSRGAP